MKSLPMFMDRRACLNTMALCSGLGLAKSFAPVAIGRPKTEIEPRYFVHLAFFGGLDPTYMFDARPLAMTASKEVQNYLGQEPDTWSGVNGVDTYVSPLMRSLRKWFPRMAIVNGIAQHPEELGHEQNQNMWFTSQATGGMTFLPPMDAALGGSILSHVVLGDPAYVTGQIYGSGARLTPWASKFLREIAGSDAGVPLETNVLRFLDGERGRLDDQGGGLARGTSDFLKAAPSFASLRQKLQMLPSAVSGDFMEQSYQTAIGVFRAGLTRCALLFNSDPLIDAHDGQVIKQSPATYARIATRIDKLVQAFADAPYGDGSRSMLDMTTILVTSEFGRTFRQFYQPDIQLTGTDHNCFANSALFVGRGVPGSTVFGETNYRVPLEDVGSEHLRIDPYKQSAVSRHFDFERRLPVRQVLTRYDLSRMISMPSVINTFMGLAGVPASEHWRVGRNNTGAIGRRLFA